MIVYVYIFQFERSWGSLKKSDELFDASYYHPPNDYHLFDLWLPPSLSQAASRAQWTRKLCEVDVGLNSPYFPEVWTETTVCNPATIASPRTDNEKQKIINTFIQQKSGAKKCH